jgi:nucleotide-binding universal stress UspA family protein
MTEALRVLIAVDGSDSAAAAARCWAGWAGDAGQPLDALLLTVAPPPPHAWPMPGSEPGRVERALLDWGDRQLEPARSFFASTRLRWEARVQVGVPADLIVEEAERLRADLIVMGTRGLNPLRGLLLGSVALRTVQVSRVPVWLMPPQADCPSALGRRLTLLVAVDGSTEATRAAAWAARIAPRFGDTAIELLSVQPAFGPLEGMLDAAAGRFDHWSPRIGRAAIEKARQEMGEAAARASTEVRSGNTVETICRRADEIGADAIVVGPRGLGAIGQAALGSVSNALLQTARRSVIVVPEAAPRAEAAVSAR